LAEALLSVRRRELAEIDRLLGRGGSAQANVILITGETGIGKTELLTHAVGGAAETGLLTVFGRAAEFESDEPFGVFLGALEALAAELSEEDLAGLRPEETLELASLLPGLAGRVPSGTGIASQPPSGVGTERYRLHRAICSLLAARAGASRVLLAVDDLHWADPASVELLLYLVRRPPRSHLDVIATFRPGQLEPATAAALQQLQRDGQGELIELTPLDREEATAFYPPGMPGRVAERIFSESGGNPFYLEELIRTAGENAQAGSSALDNDAERLPSRITAFISAELERLSPRARELIQAASMVGDPFEPELAGEIIGMDEAQTLAALDELVDRELVETAPLPGRFSFRHPIVRRAVYESAKDGWRRSAHARAAAVLGGRGASPSTRARHVERSARVGDADAIATLRQAGYEASARAPAAAARWFRAALHLLPEGTPAQERLDLLLALAVALGSAGHLLDSREAFHEALALLPKDSPVKVTAVAGAAMIDHLLGQHDQAQGLLLENLAEHDDRSEASASLKIAIAGGSFFSADWSGMRYWAEEAMKVSDPSPALSARGAALLALAHYGLSETEQAAVQASKAAAIADELSDEEWAGQLQSLCSLGWAEYCVGRLQLAEQHMKRAHRVADATGQQHLSGVILTIQANSNLGLGRLALASEQAENAIDSSLLSANNLFLTWALTMRCMVEIERGSPAAAVRYGMRALEAGIKSRSPWSNVASLYLAEARLEAGEPEQFRRQLLAGQSTPRLPPFAFYGVHAYELLTRAELDLGLPDAAGRWANQAKELAARIGLPMPIAQARRAEAMLLLSRGEYSAAAAAAGVSAEQAELAGQPLQVARSRLLEGIALSRGSDRAAAVARLRGAQEVFAAHGATRYRDRAAQELRALGIHRAEAGRRPRTETSVGALSKRELTIARLVHEGLSNRQIAEQLSISVKTVENHLTNIFRRLEISSRAQLATLIERSRGAAA
jgi:DNA-binding CsgD family transcriptional regulator/tetratricopeptide (TPR) repeat protein/RecA/RadA recombinase